jgi:hypothetical protein
MVLFPFQGLMVIDNPEIERFQFNDLIQVIRYETYELPGEQAGNAVSGYGLFQVLGPGYGGISAVDKNVLPGLKSFLESDALVGAIQEDIESFNSNIIPFSFPDHHI